MSTQRLAPKKPQIGKWMLIAAIAVPFLVLLLLLLEMWLDFDLPRRLALKFIILYLPLSFAAAILYLIREEQAAAARAWGILGGFALVPLGLGWWAFPPFFMAIQMAIGGAVLALKRPKLAGALMLAGVIMSMKGLMLLFALSTLNGPTGLYAFLETMPFLLAGSFLIPGGILALTSRKGQPASKKMVIVTIAVFFLTPALFLPFLFDFLLFLFQR